MGRMLTFSARILQDVDANPPSLSRSVGIDEHTALLLDTTTGGVQTVGVGTAYVCVADHKATVCKANTPLTFQSTSLLINSHFVLVKSHFLVFLFLTLSAFVSLSLSVSLSFVVYIDIQCTRLSGKNRDSFSFETFSGQGTVFSSNVLSGKFTNEPYGPVN